jgi:hypothetical protein
MKLPWFGRKKQQLHTIEDHTWSLSPDIDHTIDRQLYYHPTQTDAACPRCRHTLIQEQASYLVVIFNESGQETDRLMVGGNFGHYCPNCPTVVVNPADLTPYLEAAGHEIGSSSGTAVLGRVALEGFTEEENNTPVGELKSIPLVPFYSSQSRKKPRNKRRKKLRRR